MNLIKPWLLAGALCLASAMGGLPSQAQQYGKHPAYLHALSDLRLMRAYLDKLTPSERISDEQVRAIQEIDEAIRLIKEASIDDHKDMHDHMPVDAHITPSDRFRKAREAGSAAKHDLQEEEDNEYAHGLKHRALEHVENANHIVDNIIQRTSHM
jgi:hypothetical protein